MSGVVTPPPRPPRPFLPPTQQSKAAGTKPAPKMDGRAKNRPTSGTVIRTSTKPEALHRSSTYSSGSRARLVRSQSPEEKQSPSSGEEVFLPEKDVLESSSGTSEQQTQQRIRVGSPPPRSLSTSSKDDLEMRRWSYGFENKNKSPRYQPRAPPPRPPLRHTSSPEPANDSKEDLQIKRRSYTFGSVKSLPSFPVQRTRAVSTDREPSVSPKRGMSPSHSSSVEVMGTLVEKSRSASQENGAPLRPSRPPPPRTKSLPRAASLTTYKDRGLQRRPHSVSSTESNSVVRPITPQQDPPTSPAKPLPLEVNDVEQEHIQEKVKDDKERHNNVPASEEIPVIPPRPFRPPRPFPPGGTVKQKREKRTQKKRSQVQSAGSTRNGSRSVEQESSHPPPVQPEELSPEPVNNAAPVAPDVDVPIKKEAFLSDQEISDPSLDTKVSSPESVAPQETTNATSNEEPPAQSSSPETGVSEAKQPEVVAKPLQLSEEEDQLSPLPQVDSPKSRGTRFIKSMKKSFRSLRSPNRKRKQDTGRYGRPSSTSDVPTSDDANRGIYPDPLPQGIIHPIIVKCVAYLNKESVLKEEGLFRIPGDVAVIKRLRERFLAGSDVDLTEVADPHTVSGLLKLHFREQRISMIPRGQPLTTITQAVKDKDVESVRGVIQSIDVSHMAMLRIVAELLMMVSSFSDDNKMTSGTLATSCAPSMFPYLPTGSAVILMKFLIDHCAEVFQE